MTNLNTKRTLAASLKKLMGRKPLSKITVSEIVADCGINRKTFYYHFQDIYDLLKWTLEGEALEVMRSFDLLVNPEEVILYVMDYVDANQHIINCAYDSMGRDEMKRFFYADFTEVTRSVIDQAEKKLGLSVEEPFKGFLTEFYTEALTGLLIDYFRDPKKRDREKLVEYVVLTLQSSLPKILQDKARTGSGKP